MFICTHACVDVGTRRGSLVLSCPRALIHNGVNFTNGAEALMLAMACMVVPSCTSPTLAAAYAVLSLLNWFIYRRNDHEAPEAYFVQQVVRECATLALSV